MPEKTELFIQGFFPSPVDKVMQRRRRWCRGWCMISSLFMVRLRRRYWDAVICYRGRCGLSCRERRPRCALVRVSFRAFAHQLLHFFFIKETLLLRGSYKFSMFPTGSSDNQVYFLYRIKSDVIQRVYLSSHVSFYNVTTITTSTTSSVFK